MRSHAGTVRRRMSPATGAFELSRPWLSTLGLKCLDNGTDERLFHGQPKKRRGRPDGHLYGYYRLLDNGQAKALIYIPTYLELIRQQSDVVARLDPDVEILDVSYQPDTLGPKLISHAALLELGPGPGQRRHPHVCG